jgi:hypothetical protein
MLHHSHPSPPGPTADSLPKPPATVVHPPSYLWHPRQQQQQSEPVSSLDVSGHGSVSMVSPPAGMVGGTGATTPQQQHSVVLVRPSPHRPVPSHIFSSRTSSRASSPGPAHHHPAGGGAAGALARRRDRHNKMKQLTHAVREQLAQIAALAERLEEMVSGCLI